ncbi:hypothetical protein MTR67_047881 [Solanum verrucosum]|jgi:hypothetical protein
MKIL